jgi:hypothetical protein
MRREEIQEFPLYHVTLIIIMFKYALYDLGARVNVMPFSLYNKLNLDKLVSTKVSLQMADKCTAITIGYVKMFLLLFLTCIFLYTLLY